MASKFSEGTRSILSEAQEALMDYVVDAAIAIEEKTQLPGPIVATAMIISALDSIVREIQEGQVKRDLAKSLRELALRCSDTVGNA